MPSNSDASARNARSLSRGLINDPDKHIGAATCSVSKFTLVDETESDRDGLGHWKMEMNGDTSHLEKGEER